MLGRLRMKLDDREDAYLQLSKQAFTSARQVPSSRTGDFVQANGRFDAQMLEDAIKGASTQCRL